MIGWRFQEFMAQNEEGSTFEKLLSIFKELLVYTSGNVSEALSWLTELDKEYELTTPEYGMADFIQDLMNKGYLESQDGQKPQVVPTAKMEGEMRQKALDDIFNDLKKSKQGKHDTKFSGLGDERSSETRPYEFGDKLDNLAVSNSLRNAQINHGLDEFKLTQDDFAMS